MWNELEESQKILDKSRVLEGFGGKNLKDEMEGKFELVEKIVDRDKKIHYNFH